MQAFYESKHRMIAFSEFIGGGAAISKANTNVRLPDGLHQEVKKAAVLREVTIETAYEQALRGWLISQSEYVVNSGHPNLGAQNPQTIGIDENWEKDITLIADSLGEAHKRLLKIAHNAPRHATGESTEPSLTPGDHLAERAKAIAPLPEPAPESLDRVREIPKPRSAKARSRKNRGRAVRGKEGTG